MKINIISSIILLLLDFIWLQLFMKNKYRVLILNIQHSKMKINIISAILAYILMIIGLNQFVLKYKMSNMEAFLFGICLYGVYDFTAAAVIKNWNMKLAIYDILNKLKVNEIFTS